MSSTVDLDAVTAPMVAAAVRACHRQSDFSSNEDVIQAVLDPQTHGFVYIASDTVLGFLLHCPSGGVHTIFITDQGRGMGLMTTMMSHYLENNPILMWELRGSYNYNMINWYDQAICK